MLEVTEVNGCEVCSYAHTKIALEKGLSNKEIQMLLSGNVERVSADEAVAIFPNIMQIPKEIQHVILGTASWMFMGLQKH